MPRIVRVLFREHVAPPGASDIASVLKPSASLGIEWDQRGIALVGVESIEGVPTKIRRIVPAANVKHVDMVDDDAPPAEVEKRAPGRPRKDATPSA